MSCVRHIRGKRLEWVSLGGVSGRRCPESVTEEEEREVEERFNTSKSDLYSAVSYWGVVGVIMEAIGRTIPAPPSAFLSAVQFYCAWKVYGAAGDHFKSWVARKKRLDPAGLKVIIMLWAVVMLLMVTYLVLQKPAQ